MKIICFSIAILISAQLIAQEIPYPPLSPKGSLVQVIGNTTFKISYERPSVRGRVIFGELVPYDQVWRTGAGHCTVISFDRPVVMYEQEIPAGSYSLFTRPGAAEWMVMLNTDTSLVGSRDYDRGKDIIQIIAKPEKTKRLYETMTFDIEMVDNHAWIVLSWERTQIRFQMKTSTNDIINDLIQTKLLTDESKDADEFAGGAAFLIALGEDYVTAYNLATKAIELDNQSEWARNLKIQAAEKTELYDEAMAEILSTIDLLRSKGNRDKEIAQLQADLDRIAKLKKKQKK